MELRKDWSLAYFLYYICQIGYWLILINVIIHTTTTIILQNYEAPYIHDIPVTLHIDDFDDYREFELDNVNINLPSRVVAKIGMEISFTDYPFAFVYYNGLKLLHAGVFFFGLYFFSKVLKNVAEGDPFHQDNPKYLYIVGWILFLSSIAAVLLAYAPLPVLDQVTLPQGYDFSSIKIMKDYSLPGIFLIVLAYVFKEGTRIYEEQKLTV